MVIIQLQNVLHLDFEAVDDNSDKVREIIVLKEDEKFKETVRYFNWQAHGITVESKVVHCAWIEVFQIALEGQNTR